ncbi:MAG: hypothetical protein AAB767_05000 [Patescibacteria group bacterium]
MSGLADARPMSWGQFQNRIEEMVRKDIGSESFGATRREIASVGIDTGKGVTVIVLKRLAIFATEADARAPF